MWADPLVLKRKQIQMFRAITKHAYDNVPFYHAKFRAAGILPEDIKTEDDLKKIPVTTKSEIQMTSFADLIARNVDWKHYVKRETSGSTGIPLTVAVSNNAIDVENALWLRAYFEDGMKPWHKMARITDPRNFASSRRWFERLGFMQTKFISVFDEVEKQFSILEKYNPQVIRGYTTCVENLAHFCIEKSTKMDSPLVFTSAELLDRKARSAINSAFGNKLFDLYVCVEFGLIAWECRAHSGYHINTDGVFVEFARDGEIAGLGEEGTIICTGLFNEAMPLIRYCIGDIGTASNERCQCGVTLPLMKIVEGRTGDFLMTPSGRSIPPIIFFPFPFDDISDIRQFRVIQEQKDRLVIELATRKMGSVQMIETLEKAEKNLKELFGENMRIDFKIVDKINRESSGKLKKIISHVKMNNNS